MSENPSNIPIRRRISIGFLSWVVVLGIDFFLHAGLLAGLYVQSTPFLLAREDAFRLIPLGYLSILLQTTLLLWLMLNLGIQAWKEGAVFGIKLSLLLGGSMFLGLLSISTLTWQFLLGWMFAQILEMAVAGTVNGAGLRAKSLKPIQFRVVAIVVLLLILTITIQTLGWVPTVK